MIFLLLLLAVPLGCGAWAAELAEKKGRPSGGFFALGFFLGPFGVIIAAIMSTDQHALTSDRRTCPHCAEPIQRAAKVCRFCGRDVEPLSAATGKGPKSGFYTDPTSRHQLRWWDGQRWTNKVMDGHRETADPV